MQGDTTPLLIKWLSSTEQIDGAPKLEPIDLTDGTAVLSIIKNISEGVILEVDGVIADPLTGEIRFPFTKEQTRKLLGTTFNRNVLRYDIEFRQDETTKDNITSLLYGTLTVDGDITRLAGGL